MILEPNHGRYESRWERRQYEGSSVELGPDRIRWVPPTYPAYHGGGFTVAIGTRPGQAHTVTHIHTEFVMRSGAGLVDRYVVTDAGGVVLGSFPSGAGTTGSSLSEHRAGWYPSPAVRKATEGAGLKWADHDFTGDASGLEAAFPGVVPHLRNLNRAAWIQSCVYVLLGLGLFAMCIRSFLGATELQGMQVVALVMGLSLGVGLIVVGVVVAPTMLRRAHQRHVVSSSAPS